jgi:hypothetical protein
MLLYLNLHIPQQCSLNSLIHTNDPSLRLVEQHQFTFLSEAEIRHTTWANHLTDQRTSRRPDVQAVSTAAVDISWQVALDTVGDARAYSREEPLVGEEVRTRASDDVECVAGRIVVSRKPYQC